jgi:Na+-transporting NADH:ubiquinone oxidoreductase subunit C
MADSKDPYAIDGLSGATITSTGVSNIVKFWMGDHGFGKFIAGKTSASAAVGNRTSAEVAAVK